MPVFEREPDSEKWSKCCECPLPGEYQLQTPRGTLHFCEVHARDLALAAHRLFSKPQRWYGGELTCKGR